MKRKGGTGIFSLLKSYRSDIILLILFALLGNGINLLLPKIIANGIDSYSAGNYHFTHIAVQFSVAVIFIFIFTYLQSLVQTYASEKVARDMRRQLAHKISTQSYAYIERSNPSRLLTNITADADSIKLFVSQAVASIASSIFIIIGASILLLTINWQLALVVIVIIPVMGGTFFMVLRRVRVLFKKGREVIDWLNKVINESILGAALIRVVNSQQLEYDKFISANEKAKDIGLSILRLFAMLIPVIQFLANLCVLAILALGGHFVISGSMTLGDMAAFTSYLTILIFPILVIGFMSNIIAQASASYERVSAILQTPEAPETGTVTQPLQGNISVEDVSVAYGQKLALSHVSFSARAGSRIAIIGPTAAGKSQLLYLLTGLIKPTSGCILFDDVNIDDYSKESFHSQIGFVFQDSIVFNISIRENIAFSEKVTDELMKKAIDTAELASFIDSLPQHLDTVVSERGTSLSGGQKQRIMLARALAINPKVLLLDDFTARVDSNTEKKILENVQKNYPGITLISVTQKIASVEHYDQIILLMDGEIIATGTHEELMQISPEYVQIYNSQQSTSNYELQS